jgi:UDP-N-acetylmuramate dehydrogenase
VGDDRVTGLADLLGRCLRGRVERDRAMARLTTYKLGGPAALFLEPVDLDDLRALSASLGEAGAGELPLLVLGRGSNLVVSDEGWPGLVLRLGSGFSRITEGQRPHSIDVGAARPLPLVANWAARRGLAGLEWGVGVPGSVGGAVRMNAGAHGGDMAKLVLGARVMDLKARTERALDAVEFDYSYRHSSVGEDEVVIDVDLQMAPEAREVIRARMEDFRRHRAETQPGALQNAGSTFKNPPSDAAGRLVDAAGLKGFRVGGASVSRVHANFFMADEGAAAQDVFDLVQEVRRRVAEAFGVELEPEVRFAGSFRMPVRGGG